MSASLICNQGPNQVLDSESFTSTKADGCVKLRMGAEDDASKLPPISVPDLLKNAATEAPEVVALSVNRDEKWIKWTYKEYLEDVRAVAKAFIALGLEPRQSVAIMGFNSPEWFWLIWQQFSATPCQLEFMLQIQLKRPNTWPIIVMLTFWSLKMRAN